MQNIKLAEFNTPFIKHKSLCPRSRIRDADNLGRFKFIPEKRARVTNHLNEFLDAHIDLRQDVTPGPGDYDIATQPNRKKLGIILGQHTVYNSSKQPMPGPGRYDTASKSVISKFKASPNVIFSPPRVQRFKNAHKMQTPGPGQYDTGTAPKLLSNFSTSQIYSMSKTRRAEIIGLRTLTPGPTAYNTILSRKKAKSVSKFKFVHGFAS